MSSQIVRTGCLGVMLATGVASADQTSYVQTNLVSNSAEFAPQIIDPNMLDAWGIALRPPGAGGHIWISNAFTGTSSEYIGDVNGQPLHQDPLKSVTLDTPNFTDHGTAFVTGQVYNAASDLPNQAVEFPVSGTAHNLNTGASLGTVSGPAKFVFVTEDGAINAWRSNTAEAMDHVPVMIDYSKTSTYPYAANSVFSGVAITTHAVAPGTSAAQGNHLFTTDFRNNAIEVIDDKWNDVTSGYHFQTPATVGGLHAFNIQDLSGHLFVTYAEFNEAGDEGFEQTNGQGLGHIVEYNEDGTLVRDFADNGALDAPWGMTLAPATFGQYANDLLVGNFGDGTISAFDPASGQFLGDLKNSSGQVISIDGLWGLTFGNGVSLGDANALYFTAGPNNEEDGLFGRLNVAVPEPSSLALLGVAGALLGRRRPRGTILST